MNIFIRHCFLVVLFALLFEIIEMGDAYKLIRPYKYYQRRPLRRPRLYTGHKSSKFHHSKRIPPEDYYSRRPGYYRYGSSRDDFDGRFENNPYTIVIQLPKGEDKYEDDNEIKRNRKFERTIPVYTNENDYIDDEDDFESKVVNVNNKRVRIKMIKGENPKLHIKISRSDNDKDIEIVDKSDIAALDSPLLPETYKNLIVPVQQSTKNWTSTLQLNNFQQNHVQPF